GLPEQARSVVESGLTGALAVATEMGGEPGAALARAANEAFVDGMSAAAVAGPVVVLVAAVAAWFLLPEGQDVASGAVPGGSPEGSAAGEVIEEGIVEPSPVH